MNTNQLSLYLSAIFSNFRVFPAQKMEVTEELTPCLAVCCMCGINISPNPVHMCMPCLRTQVNITENLAKRVNMHQCRGCLKVGVSIDGWIDGLCVCVSICLYACISGSSYDFG